MRLLILLTFVSGLVFPAAAQDIEKLAPYYPTPNTIVEKMLRLGSLKAGEKVFDLGSGDGRIVIIAAQKFHANAIGVEMDKDLCRQSTEKIRKLGLWSASPPRSSTATSWCSRTTVHGGSADRLPAADLQRQGPRPCSKSSSRRAPASWLP